MIRKFTVSVAAIALLAGLTGCNGFSSGSAAEGEGDAIVLTDVDFDPDSLIPETQPLADYLGNNLRRAGISDGKVKIAPNVATVSEWMASGEVNLYFDSVYPAMLVMEESGALPILRRWKDGVPEYNTFIVTTVDSNITGLDDLKGQMLSMESPSSSSGFMFPMIAMLEAGLNPVEKAEANHTVADDEVGYVFSGDPENTVDWILEGRVQAGAVDNETWDELSPEEKAELTIIAETEKFPRHMVLAGPSLSEETIAALKRTMTRMDESRKGRKALAEFSETAQFDEFPEGADQEIERLREAYDMLQAHLAQ